MLRHPAVTRLDRRAFLQRTGLTAAAAAAWPALGDTLAAKPPIAMRLCKQRFREVTQPAFDEAFAAGPRYQEEALGTGGPQGTMGRVVAELSGEAGEAEAVSAPAPEEI